MLLVVFLRLLIVNISECPQKCRSFNMNGIAVTKRGSKCPFCINRNFLVLKISGSGNVEPWPPWSFRSPAKLSVRNNVRIARALDHVQRADETWRCSCCCWIILCPVRTWFCFCAHLSGFFRVRDIETSVCPREQLIPMRYIDDDGNATETPGNLRVCLWVFSRTRRDLAGTINSVIRQFAMNVFFFRVVAFTFCWSCFFVFTFFFVIFCSWKKSIHCRLLSLITNHHQSYAGSPNVPRKLWLTQLLQKSLSKKIIYFCSGIHGGTPNSYHWGLNSIYRFL